MLNQEKFAKVLDKVWKDAEKNKDFELAFNKLRMDDYGRIFSLDKGTTSGVELSDFAKTQLFTKTEMPVKYMKKMLNESPRMVAEHFNYWASQQDTNILIRAVKENGHNRVRGILSDKYTILDNKDVLESLSKISEGLPELNIVNQYIDDKKMHLRLAFPDLYEDFGVSPEGKDDIVQVALDIQNSEIGYSSLTITPVTYRLVCTNGMKAWVREDGFSKRHVHMEPSELRELMEVAMKDGMDKGRELIEAMKQGKNTIVMNPYEKIDEIVSEYGLSGKASDTIKLNFEIEPERNLFGIVNSFTRTARDLTNHDTRLKLETIASDILKVA